MTGIISDEKYSAKNTFSGQHHKYGDFIIEWEIETEEPKESVIEWCFNNLCSKRVPSHNQWIADCFMKEGEHYGDAGYYFNGYYSIDTLYGKRGYSFCLVQPYAD